MVQCAGSSMAVISWPQNIYPWETGPPGRQTREASDILATFEDLSSGQKALRSM